MRTDGQTDMTNLIVVFSQFFANAPEKKAKKENQTIMEIICKIKKKKTVQIRGDLLLTSNLFQHHVTAGCIPDVSLNIIHCHVMPKRKTKIDITKTATIVTLQFSCSTNFHWDSSVQNIYINP